MSARSDIAQSIASVARAKVDRNQPYAGEAPDLKQPPLRSDTAISEAAVELLKLFGRKAKSVYSVCGIGQDFYLVDRGWYNKRADLMLTGRTLVGAPSPENRRLEGQCGGPINNERALNYMNDVCTEAHKRFNIPIIKFGVDVVAYHNAAAPNQYVFAPIYEERSDLAISHNLLLMDTMRKVAPQHKLVCLLNEKPFAGLSGNGKRVNWSLSDDSNNNLFNPGDTAEENLVFLTLMVSVIQAAHRHGDLLRAAAASAGNERRLGAGGAPPVIMSVSLGEQLTKIISLIESGKTDKGKKRDLADLGLGSLPIFTRDAANRDLAAPFVFTGADFEFRMPGASMDVSAAVTVVNAIVADSIKLICERINKELGNGKGDKPAAATGGSAAKGEGGGGDQQADADPRKQETMTAAVMNVLSAVIKESKSVLFDGDNRSSEWAKEAQARGLQNIVSTPEALKAFIAPKTVELFGRQKIFSEAELKAMYNAGLDEYERTFDAEIKTLTDIINTQVLPAAYNYQADIASGLEVLRVLADDMTIEMADGALEDRKEMFERLTADIFNLRKSQKELFAMADKARGMGTAERAAYMFKEIKPQMDRVRQYADALEGSMPDEQWPLPKYKEMLFIV